MGEEEGALQEEEAEMIHEIIKLGDKTAKDCMTPRVDSFTLPDDWTNGEVIARLKEKRHRRVPVYADTPDQILGIIDVKMFLLEPSDHYTEKLIAPSFVPETMRALDLLKLFLTHPQGMAVVVDEFGGTEGIITMSDIVEEIISDALPRGDVDLYIEPLEHGKFLVSGNARLDDLSEHLGFQIEAEEIDTIVGFVFTRLGYLPASGAKLEIPRLAITVRRLGVNELRRFCWKKPPARTLTKARTAPALQHDSRIRHFLLLDCFVLLQRDRKRATFDRSGAITPKCEASCARGPATQSSVKTSGSPARHGFVLHKCVGLSRSVLTDVGTGSIVRVCRVFLGVRNGS